MIASIKKTLIEAQTAVTVANVKAALQIDYNTEDAYLSDVIERAVGSYENITGRSLNLYEYHVVIVGPHNRPLPGHPIELDTIQTDNGEVTGQILSISKGQVANVMYEVGGEVEQSDAANIIDIASLLYQSKMVEGMELNNFIIKNYRSRIAKSYM